MEHQDTKKLQQLLSAGKFEPYIRHIRFPRFKNLEADTKINFDFPITALVGANGTNKSSVLKALFGTPDYHNLGNYWFSTSTDPIAEAGDDSGRNCFIHGYLNGTDGEIVEVLKTRVSRDDPDTWEPSRPVAKYGMALFKRISGTVQGKSETRWKAIDKKVVLIDFRQTLSAFDRFFYHGDFGNFQTLKSKKSYIRKMASHLREVLEEGYIKYPYYGIEKIVNDENRELSAEEVSTVSEILDRKYLAIKLVQHRFFKMSGYTVQLVFGDLQYTEAFAGSGEFAAVMLVVRILSAEPNSLILLDEPEVSLHPGAQQRLLNFLFRQSMKHHHQVVIATHSPAMIRSLPEDAIKIFGLDPLRNQVRLICQKALPEEAFFHVGEPVTQKRTVYVEDRLARELVLRALRDHEPEVMPLVEIAVIPGGAETLLKFYAPIFARAKRRDILFLLDGDKTPDEGWPDPDGIPASSDLDLINVIKSHAGVKIDFPTDSGTDSKKAAQLIDAQRQFIGWCRLNVQYLPGAMPESFILNKLNIHIDSDPKLWFQDAVRQELRMSSSEEPNANDIWEKQKWMLAKITQDDPDLKSLAEAIRKFISAGTD